MLVQRDQTWIDLGEHRNERCHCLNGRRRRGIPDDARVAVHDSAHSVEQQPRLLRRFRRIAAQQGVTPLEEGLQKINQDGAVTRMVATDGCRIATATGVRHDI